MTAYPKTYRASRGWRIFLATLSLLAGILSFLGIIFFSVADFRDHFAVYLGGGICGLVTVSQVYLFLTALRSKIVLYPDAMEIHEVARSRTVRRDDVAGWRFTGASTLVLKLKHPVGKTISVSWFYTVDSEFEEWFADLDNLDVREVASGLDEIANDQSLGSHEQDRFERLAHARRLARGLNILGGVLSVWGLFFPTPYGLVVGLLLLAPWLAILTVRRSDGLIQFDERPNDVKPSVIALYLFPMLALTLRAVWDYETIGWIAPTIATVLIGSSLFAGQYAALRGVRTSRITLALLLVFAVVFYGFGAARHINALADSSDVQQMRYAVRDKYISRGKVMRYEVRLRAPNPNAPQVRSAQVTPDFYDTLKPGDSVCLAIHRGALWIQWFETGPCPAGTP